MLRAKKEFAYLCHLFCYFLLCTCLLSVLTNSVVSFQVSELIYKKLSTVHPRER